jgi:hypothetical protein
VLVIVLFSSHKCIPRESTFFSCKKFADGIEKLYCECSRLDYFKFEDYYYIICPLRCPAVQSPTGSDLVNKEAKAPSLFFCHNKHSVNNASNLIKNPTLVAQLCQNETFWHEFMVTEK